MGRWSLKFEISVGREEVAEADDGGYAANLSGSVVTHAVDGGDGYYSVTDHGNGEDEYVSHAKLAERRGRVGF